MPTPIRSPRYSDDSIKLRRAAIALGWGVMRLAGWRCPGGFEPEEPVLFAEPLFDTAVAEQLGLAVVEPPEEFLVQLPREYVGRSVRLMTAAGARTLPGPLFLKPPILLANSDCSTTAKGYLEATALAAPNSVG